MGFKAHQFMEKIVPKRVLVMSQNTQSGMNLAEHRQGQNLSLDQDNHFNSNHFSEQQGKNEKAQ
jgi:hypothetical protein